MKKKTFQTDRLFSQPKKQVSLESQKESRKNKSLNKLFHSMSPKNQLQPDEAVLSTSIFSD